MAAVRIELDSRLAPERVLAAARDFTARRSQLFPAVQPEYFEVHELGDTTADVTEGTKSGPMFNWERCDYDWSQPGAVTALVTDSNIYAIPGSLWRIRVTARDGGSHVEMTWERVFRRTPKGILLTVVFRTLGRRLFGSYARETIDNIERLEPAT